MSKNRKIRSVSFSKKDPFEMLLFKHAEKNGVFSKYIKRLIQRDMEGVSLSNLNAITAPTSFQIEETKTPPVKEQEVKVSMSNRKATSFI
ncbi:hypothetical protein NST14_12015 [Bacillus sp. FSL W8-0519]|uniref:hypothetical protein n=1 Tax=Bacillus sp. FSL W8-0519 TaxID=2954624 RepID=UPI0009378453